MHYEIKINEILTPFFYASLAINTNTFKIKLLKNSVI